jgi:hypothetical protein
MVPLMAVMAQRLKLQRLVLRPAQRPRCHRPARRRVLPPAARVDQLKLHLLRLPRDLRRASLHRRSRRQAGGKPCE